MYIEYSYIYGDILSYIRMHFEIMTQVNIFFPKSQAIMSVLPLLKNQCGTWLHVYKLKPLIFPVCHLQIKVLLQPLIMQHTPDVETKLYVSKEALLSCKG